MTLTGQPPLLSSASPPGMLGRQDKPDNVSPADGRASSGGNRSNGRSTKSKSGSPTRGSNRKGNSRSPRRNNKQKSKSRSPNPSRNSRSQNHASSTSPNKNRHPAQITVITNRVDLWDSAAHYFPAETDPSLLPCHDPNMRISSYRYVRRETLPSEGVVDYRKPVGASPSPGLEESGGDDSKKKAHRASSRGPVVAIAYVPHQMQYNEDFLAKIQSKATCDVMDTTTPNPHHPSVVHDKYWVQRRRLFSRFDQGIQLDGQGWYSVTPEIIADHVASRVAQLAATAPRGITLLDAFCGCGGNSIAFGKIPSHLIEKVVCLDTDRSKLLKAAHNASIYGIPRDKLVFVECNAIFVMRHVYKDGKFILDQPHLAMPPYMPPPVMPTVYAGYNIGGLDLLPRRIDAVFMDPPWGGIDYEVLGKNGYCLEKNMKIKVSPDRPAAVPVAPTPSTTASNSNSNSHVSSDVTDDFFDDFMNSSRKSKPNQKMTDAVRKANFNKCEDGDGEFINGADLIQIAAEATFSRVVIYDLPRNTNKMSLGRSALKAGYHGNLKLEEHYLNGRLKTVTAYMGADFSFMLDQANHQSSVEANRLTAQTRTAPK